MAAPNNLTKFLTNEPKQVPVSRQMRLFVLSSLLTLFAFTLLTAYLSPFAYMASTSLKDLNMISTPGSPLLPYAQATMEYNGKEVKIYQVPTDEGVRELALIKPGRQESTFIDPANPDGEPIVWQGKWRTLEPAFHLSPRWENYSQAWTVLNFPLILRNTLAIALIGVVGTLMSCIATAYGFARFPIPYKNVLFLILISTISLPRFVTLVPTYAVFTYIGWTGTWLPLIVPHFFANAYNVFLLRQFFLTIPRALDEAATIDGANPLRILVSIIVPNSWPAIVAVSLFHFFYAWNDFFEPLIYLSSTPNLQPISVAMQVFNALYAQQPHLIQATAMLGLALPVLLFFMAQKVFLQGASMAGVSK
ncbi:MAG: carbohydrate ABC transporter permease [Calditrichaeota bacterium]|nr:MAG: carbohydrate ABC transporter permease [Calditrichota bacterium]